MLGDRNLRAVYIEYQFKRLEPQPGMKVVYARTSIDSDRDQAQEANKPNSTPQALSVPAGSPRWDLEGQAKVSEYQGRECLLLDGGAAVLKDFEMRDGVVDVDVATGARGLQRFSDIMERRRPRNPHL